MSIEDRQWYKEDSVRRAGLPDPLGPKRYVRSSTASAPVTKSAPDLPSGLIVLGLLFLLAVGSVASCFL